MKKIAVIIRNSRQFNAIRDESIKRNYNWAKGTDGIEHLKFDPDSSGIEYFIFDPVRTVRYDGNDSDLRGCLIIEFDEWALLTGVELVYEVKIQLAYCINATVELDRVTFEEKIDEISSRELEEIYAAYKSLQS